MLQIILNKDIIADKLQPIIDELKKHIELYNLPLIDLSIEINEKDAFKPKLEYIVDYDLDTVTNKKTENTITTYINYKKVDNKPKVILHSIAK